MLEKPIILETGSGSIDSCIIWLHGLGADGHDFESIVPQLNLPDSLNIRFVFPHAPERAVTINQGYVMRAWYDIVAMDIAAEQDEQGIRQSEVLCRDLIQQQLDSGLRSERIILAGFSQGGAIILHTGLRYTKPLAGLMALSTYLPVSTTLDTEKSAENQLIDIFSAHGSDDPVIPVSFAQKSHFVLTQQGYKPEWHEYEGMQHSVCFEEIADISQWIIQRLGANL